MAEDTKNTKVAANAQEETNEGADKKEEKAEKTVSLPKKTLEAILNRIEGLEKANEQILADSIKKDEKIEMLTNISDKARLSRYEDQNRGALIRTAKIAFWNDRPIIAWAKGRDEVGFHDGKLVVNQTIKVLTAPKEEGGEPDVDEIDYRYWSQNVVMKSGEVISKNETNEGTFWTVQLKDGQKITVDIRFINAF